MVYTYCFLSSYCVHSEKLNELIETFYPHNEMKFVMIEDIEPVDIPSYLSVTPSVVLYGDNGEMQIYKGQEVFDWLHSEIIKMRSSFGGTSIAGTGTPLPGLSETSTTLFSGSSGISGMGLDTTIKDANSDVMRKFEEQQQMYEHPKTNS